MSDGDLEAIQPRLAEVVETLDRRRRTGSLAFARLPGDRHGLARVRALAAEVRGRFDDLVVLGSGGALLGVRAVMGTSMLGSGEASDAGGALRVHVADTIDPTSFAALLDRLDLRRTLFDVVSELGDTPETMSRLLIVRERLLRDLGAVEYRQHVVVTTDAAHGALRQVVHDEGFRALAWPADVRGALTALSAVALFPAACAGIDVQAVTAGAHDMAVRCWTNRPESNPALHHAAALHIGLERRASRVVVVSPYGDALIAVAEWTGEVWDELLRAPTTGTRADGDSTPGLRVVRERGPYASVAADEITVFLRLERHPRDLTVPRSYQDLDAVGYLGGQELGHLLALTQQGAEAARAAAGCLTSMVSCPQLTPFALGQLLFLLEMTGAVLAALRHAAPSVATEAEEGAPLVAALAGRPGREAQRAEALRRLATREARRSV